jgi:hypothetical protein
MGWVVLSECNQLRGNGLPGCLACVEGLQAVERIDVSGMLIVSDALDSRKAEREPGFVAAALLDFAEGHLDDDFGAYGRRPLILSRESGLLAPFRD